MPDTPDICPNCGAELPPNAKACRECGSDHHTGWSETARHDGLDLPDEEFDYEDFVQREFGQEKRSPVPRGLHWFWWLAAIAVAAGLLLMTFGL
jgi:hypothetical protein